MNPVHPYRWHVLGGLAFFTVLTLIFFAVASRREPLVITDEEPIETIAAPTVTFIDPSKGPEQAAVTIVEFGDFTCGPCADMAETLSRLANTYPNDVRIVWKDFPNESKSDQATPAALAARCADEQDRFWAYHDELFLRQSLLSETTYYAIAEDLDLNINAFARCYQSQEPLPRIVKDFQEGLALELTATPTLFIGEERLVGAISYDDLENTVRYLLSTAP